MKQWIPHTRVKSKKVYRVVCYPLDMNVVACYQKKQQQTNNKKQDSTGLFNW